MASAFENFVNSYSNKDEVKVAKQNQSMKNYFGAVERDFGNLETSAAFDDPELQRYMQVQAFKAAEFDDATRGSYTLGDFTGETADVGVSLENVMTGTRPTGTEQPDDDDYDPTSPDDPTGSGPPATPTPNTQQPTVIYDPLITPTGPQQWSPSNFLDPNASRIPPTAEERYPGTDQGRANHFVEEKSREGIDKTYTLSGATATSEQLLRQQIFALQSNPPSWVATYRLQGSWPPLKDLGKDITGSSVVGIDWEAIDELMRVYDPDYANSQKAIEAAKIEQENIAKRNNLLDPELQAKEVALEMPGMPGVTIPVMRQPDGTISEINIPGLDKQIDRAILEGDINKTRSLIGIRDMPSPIEKMNVALQLAKSPASVHQLSQMAAGGPTMDRFGEIAPFLSDAARGVFGDQIGGLQKPTDTGWSSARDNVQDPYRNYDPAFPKPESGWFAALDQQPQGNTGMNGQAGMPAPSMGLGGAFIQEAPSDITGAALEDWYERDPYERRPEVAAPGQVRHMYQVAPKLGPTAGMTYEQKIAAGRGDLYGTTSEYVDDPDAEFAARYQSPQYIAEQEELQRINDLAKKYSFAGITAPSPTSSPAPSSTPVWSDTSTPTASGGPLTTPGAVDTTMGANATKTNPVTASIQQAMGERGYFLGNAGTSSPAMPQQFIDPEQEQNMFLPTGFTAGLPDRVGTVLQGGNPINQPANLLSRPEINLRTPSMQAASRWLPEERQVAEAEMQMRGISPDYLWQSVKQHTPGPAVSNTANRIAGIDFRNRRRV